MTGISWIKRGKAAGRRQFIESRECISGVKYGVRCFRTLYDTAFWFCKEQRFRMRPEETDTLRKLSGASPPVGLPVRRFNVNPRRNEIRCRDIDRSRSGQQVPSEVLRKLLQRIGNSGCRRFARWYQWPAFCRAATERRNDVLVDAQPAAKPGGRCNGARLGLNARRFIGDGNANARLLCIR